MEDIEVVAKVEKIVRADEKTAFCIARVKPESEKFDAYLNMYGNFSVFGNAFLMEDMTYSFKGNFKKNGYGYTLYFSSCEKVVPTDIEGIEAYIQTFDGIGPSIAKRIVEQFGEETLDIMEESPRSLLKVRGISESKLDKIMENFTRDKDFEKLSTFLAKYDISTKKIVKIYERFGKGAEKKISENPYILCGEVEGISFKTSDIIAKRMDFPCDHFYRLEAGIIYILREYCYKKGNLFVYEHDLAKTFESLFTTKNMIRFEEILDAMETQGEIVRADDNDKIYLKSIFKIEEYVARKTVKLCGKSNKIKNIEKYIAQAQKDFKITYDEKQLEGIRTINSGSNFNIITGGPGTGKSTIIRAILNVLQKDNPELKVKLAAPTGRAAKRMEEATGHPASTMHRLLEFNPYDGYNYNSNNPLPADVVILDESSMVDIELFCSFINAIGKDTRLFLIGDIDQLPPVGLGYVFRDLINSGIVPVVKLNKVFRQGEGSIIKLNSKNIREGNTKLEQKKGVFEFSLYKKQDDRSDIKAVQEKILEIYEENYNKEIKRNSCTAVYQTQVLTPMWKGELGVFKINELIQRKFNKPAVFKKEFSFLTKDKKQTFIFREGDKVMQLKNDYDKGVFNGDMGIIVKIYAETMDVKFENGDIVTYEKSEIRENLVLAYATTVHKSQGSEYNSVIVVCSYAHAIMRQRNLFYTAVTRAKEKVNIVGDAASVAISIKTVKSVERNSRLKERLELYNKRAA